MCSSFISLTNQTHQNQPLSNLNEIFLKTLYNYFCMKIITNKNKKKSHKTWLKFIYKQILCIFFFNWSSPSHLSTRPLTWDLECSWTLWKSESTFMMYLDFCCIMLCNFVHSSVFSSSQKGKKKNKWIMVSLWQPYSLDLWCAEEEPPAAAAAAEIRETADMNSFSSLL